MNAKTMEMSKIMHLLMGRSILATIIFCSFITQSLVGQITIIEDENYESLSAVVNRPEFKGKVIYIDMWGTRCVPCIEEFPESQLLKRRFENRKIEFLYLALDYGHPDDKERWIKMTREQKLGGYHMFISKELYVNIWKAIEKEVKTMYLIPHYILVDKSGNVIDADAARPSSKEILYAKLERAIED